MVFPTRVADSKVPPLWLGPTCYAAQYLEWAIPFAMSYGIQASQLSAEAVVGSYAWETQGETPSTCSAGSGSTNGHNWSPTSVLNMVFEKLNIPKSQRTYAISFREEHKCHFAYGNPCTDLDPPRWAEQTLQAVISTVGVDARSHVIMTEGGTNEAETWPAQFAFEHMGALFQRYGLPGGNFWIWAYNQNTEDADPTIPHAIKQRGTDFTYFPPKNEIVDLGGFHLSSIPKGSFEGGVANLPPSLWTVAGDGTGVKYFLPGEPNEPPVPSRGMYDLHLTTGNDMNAVVTASSQTIPISPNTTYTTTGNLRFAWTGDPHPRATQQRVRRCLSRSITSVAVRLLPQQRSKTPSGSFRRTVPMTSKPSRCSTRPLPTPRLCRLSSVRRDTFFPHR